MSPRGKKTQGWIAALAVLLTIGAAGGGAIAQEARPSDQTAQDRATPAAKAAVAAESAFFLPGVDAELLRPFQPLLSPAQANKEPAGHVDWSKKTIVAAGRAVQGGPRGADAVMARRGASAVALRNALAVSAGVRIGLNGRIEDLKEGTVTLQGHLKGFRVTRTYSRKKDGRTVWLAEVHVPMFGARGVATGLYEAQLRAHRRAVAGMKRASLAASAKGDEIAGDLLVIDARGSGFSPCMYPAVVDESGRILLDMVTVTKDVAVKRGPCAYGVTKTKYERLQTLVDPGRRVGPVQLASAPSPAWQNADGVGFGELLLARAAGVPTTTQTTAPTSQPATRPVRKRRRFVIRAARSKGRNKAILVITSKDALKLLKDPKAAGLARDGRVLVVIDAVAAGVEGRLGPPRRPGRPADALARAG
jgi:hypothetical protein